MPHKTLKITKIQIMKKYLMKKYKEGERVYNALNWVK